MNLFLTITLLFLHYTAFTQFTTSIPTEETHLFISEDLISSGYTQVSLVTAQNDPNIQDLLTFGMQYLTEQEILAERLPYAEYEISQILGIYNQVSTGTRYCFDVDITNDQGWVLRATYVIYSQPSTGQKEVTSYVYAVTVNPISGGEEEAPDEEDVGDGFYPIDKAGLEANQELQDALNYGINETTSQGILNHQLPESEYTLVEIYSIYGQMMTSTSYRFDVELRNCAGLTVRMIFIVYFDNELQTYGLTPIYLSITLIPSQGLIGGYCSLDGWPTSEEEVTLGPIWKESDGFISVDFNQSEIDPEIEKALGSGLEEAIAQAVHDGELPDQVYQQDGLYSIEKQAIDGVKYRFDIGLSGDGDVFARVRFVVSYDQGNHTYNLSSYLVVYVEDPAEEPAS